MLRPHKRRGIARGPGAGARTAVHVHTPGRRNQSPSIRRLRRGEVNSSTILVGMGILLVIAAAVWFSWQRTAAELGEQQLELPMVCAECGHVFIVSYDEMMDMASKARKMEAPEAGFDLNSPVGICPQCGKLAVYRAYRDPQTDQVILPEFVTGK